MPTGALGAAAGWRPQTLCRRRHSLRAVPVGRGTALRWAVCVHMTYGSDYLVAGVSPDITLTTGVELIGPAPDFQVLCDTGGPGAGFPRSSAGKGFCRDHRYGTKPEKRK